MNWFRQRLSKREKVLVVGSLAILFLILFHYALVIPYLRHIETVKVQLELQPQLFKENLRFLDRKAEIESDLEKTRAKLKGFEPILLSGDASSALNASTVQEAVQNLANKEGIQIITTRVPNPEVLGSFRSIPIQLEVSGEIDQLANFIKGIEGSKDLLIINGLDMHSLYPAAVIERQLAVGQTPVRSLRASLTVSGIARMQGSSSSSKESEAGPSNNTQTRNTSPKA